MVEFADKSRARALLQDADVRAPSCPRDSQHSPPAPELKGANSLLSALLTVGGRGLKKWPVVWVWDGDVVQLYCYCYNL